MLQIITDNQNSLQYSLPALTITSTLLTNLVLTSFMKKAYGLRVIRYNTIGGLLLATYFNVQLYAATHMQANITLFNTLLYLDTWHIGIYQLLITNILILLLIPPIKSLSRNTPSGLYESTLLGSLIGAYGMIMANHWLVIYLGLSFMTICSTILIYTGYKQQRGITPSFNYLIYQALASSIMLWGMSCLYSTDHLSLKVATALNFSSQQLWIVGTCLALSGICLQLGIFPFHFWINDVYDKVSTPVLAYLATIPTMAALSVLASIYSISSAQIFPYSNLMQSILAIMAIGTLLIGYLGALRQTKPRLLLAYASIAQRGMLLACLLVYTNHKFALSYYSLFYMLASLVMWLSLGLLETHVDTTHLEHYAGLGRRLPMISIGLCISLLAFIGLPPTMGFISKWLAFTEIWATAQMTCSYFVWLLWIVGLLGSVFSLYYYLKVPYTLFFKSQENLQATLRSSTSLQWLLIFLASLLIILFFTTHPFISLLPTIQPR